MLFYYKGRKKRSKTSLGTDLLTFVGPTHGRGVEAPCGQCVEEDLLDRAEASLEAVDTTVHTFTNCNHDETFPWACSGVKHKTITLTAVLSEAVDSTSMYMQGHHLGPGNIFITTQNILILYPINFFTL